MFQSPFQFAMNSVGQLHPQSARRRPLSDYVGCCSTLAFLVRLQDILQAVFSKIHLRYTVPVSTSVLRTGCFDQIHLEGELVFFFSARRWFGVKDTWVSQNTFGDGIASASHKTVRNASSVKVCRCKTDKTVPFQQV